MGNYYEIERERLEELGNKKDFKVVESGFFDIGTIFSEARNNKEDWVILMDPDVDKSLILNKKTKTVYDLTYKGYELIEFEFDKIVGINLVYEYLSLYLMEN